MPLSSLVRNDIYNGENISMANPSKTDDVGNDTDELSGGSVVHGSRCECNDPTNCICIDGCRGYDGGFCCVDGSRVK